MARKILDGILVGVGIVIVVGVAYAIALAGDIFTVEKDGATKFAVSDQGKITVGATESYVNLVIQNDEVSTEADNKVDITADVLTVEGIRLESVNVAADITASGAGGLDTGSEAANAWYYVWVITNNSGTSTNGLLSASSTSPTLPSGYTKKRRVGAVRNDGSSNFLQFVQEGNRIRIYPGQVALLLGTSTSLATVDLSSFMPPTSRVALLNLDMDILHYASSDFSTSVRANGANGACMTNRIQSVNGAYVRNKEFGDCITDASQVIQYIINSNPATAGGITIVVRGYYDRM